MKHQRAELRGMPFSRLQEHLDEVGVGRRHASRVFRGIHRNDQALEDIPDLGRHAGVISESTRWATAELERMESAEDGTHKMVIALADGARVEAVLVPMQGDRTTLCVSSQVGCAMGCTFCATGGLGLIRGLEAGEIVAQVHLARRVLAQTGRRVTRLVFMGMGEPLHHYEATRDALRVILDGHGMSFGSRHVVVSTVGLVPKMARLGDDFGGRVCLALSLHAGTDATRRQIVPLARQVDLATLKRALLEMPRAGSRKIMVEYVVLPGLNDSEAELDGLADWMSGLPGVVNLIPFNPFPGLPFRSPTREEVERLRAGLNHRRVPATVRWPRGREAASACGQLALAPSADEDLRVASVSPR